MSTYRAVAMANRIILIHDMPDQTVFSELDVEQADLLLQQMEIALKRALLALKQSAGIEARGERETASR